MKVDKSLPVCVTGASGYVAGPIVERLLKEGLVVHATVRDPKNKDRVGHLLSLAEKLSGELKLFKADLTEEGSFDAAVAGCQVVFHTASPFFTKFKDAQKELVDPAVNGTRYVLSAASKSPSVNRVIVTSSCAAVYGDNIDAKGRPDLLLNEDDWNTTSSLKHNAYHFSKAEAERAAWKIAEQQDQWQLVTVNPSFVFGPGVQVDLSSESMMACKMFGDGQAKAGLPNHYTGVVDVRDLAEAHFRSGFYPDASGRYIASGSDVSMMGLCKPLLDKYGEDYPLPRKAIPKWMMWLLGPMTGMSRKFISRNLNFELNVDNSKSMRELGMVYRPLEETVQDMFQQLIDEGVL